MNDSQSDHLVIATGATDRIRIYAIRSTLVVERARELHNTWPTATAALGRVLSGALMMGVMSDSVNRLTVQFQGNGPLGLVMAVSNQRGAVKGYIENPEVDLDLNGLGKLDVGRAIGSGTVTVIKDHALKNPYNGIVPIQNGEIGHDLAYYFTKSEQTPSAVGLGVLVAPDGRVQVAGGFIIQPLPGCPNEVVSELEEIVGGLPPVTTLLDSGVVPQELARYFGFDSFKVLETLPVRYHCDCSKERLRGPLLSLGGPELDSIIQEQGQIEVRCQFCDKVYHFVNSELD